MIILLVYSGNRTGGTHTSLVGNCVEDLLWQSLSGTCRYSLLSVQIYYTHVTIYSQNEYTWLHPYLQTVRDIQKHNSHWCHCVSLQVSTSVVTCRWWRFSLVCLPCCGRTVRFSGEFTTFVAKDIHRWQVSPLCLPSSCRCTFLYQVCMCVGCAWKSFAAEVRVIRLVLHPVISLNTSKSRSPFVRWLDSPSRTKTPDHLFEWVINTGEMGEAE